MYRLLTLLSLLIIITACKTETKKQNTEVDIVSEVNKELTAAEKIAKAHGFNNWKDVNQIEFTFQVNRNDKQGDGRSWKWFPKKDSIIMEAGEQHVAFNRKHLDSVPLNADRAFINDKFWLLVPFQLVWDQGKTISEPMKNISPISKIEMNKITVIYGSEGGYTPGDAYDIYFDDDYIIREWIFRQGNAEEPTMTTTFENYENFKGLIIAKDHKNAEANLNLHFSNIEVN